MSEQNRPDKGDPYTMIEKTKQTESEAQSLDSTVNNSPDASKPASVGDKDGIAKGHTEQGNVDVNAAENDFNQLQRELTHASSKHLGPKKDLESLPDFDDEDFDLRTYLRGVRARSDYAGVKHKRVGVIWDDLTVEGIGMTRVEQQNFVDAVIGFFNIFKPMYFAVKMAINPAFLPKKKILNQFSGVAKEGEMVLVLGRPGSGCTTFLKAVSNQKKGYTGVDGRLLYAGIPGDDFRKKYQGEVVYNEEDDFHFPSLTVAQTLRFAIKMKTPGHRLPEQSKKNFTENLLQLFGRMYGITHTFNTVVGDAFLRGVSGGEKKRVSIAEMMAAGASVTAWDNSSRGLDASTALTFAKSLRIYTDVLDVTTFCTLYQAGEGIYQQFDKVLLVDKGREIYFGPANKAVDYFTRLGFYHNPRQTSADFLTGITDVNERIVQKDWNKPVPKTPEELEKAFRESPEFRVMKEEMAAYEQELAADNAKTAEFQKAIIESKQKGVRKGSKYTVPYYTQIWECAIREAHLKWGNKSALATRYGTFVLISVVIGTLFLHQPLTTSAIFTRGGVLYSLLLFNALSSFVQLGDTMTGRQMLYKQERMAFYRPWAIQTGRMIADVPFIGVQIVLFLSIAYFAVGLKKTAGAFFTDLLITFLTTMAMAAFSRTWGAISRGFDFAFRYAGFAILLLIFYTGYLIYIPNMHPWFSWIRYVNPLFYAFEAVMGVEFKGQRFLCDGQYLVPQGPMYTDTRYQKCTTPGSVPGSNYVLGDDYLSTGLQYSVDHIWRNVGILVAFWIGYCLCDMIASEFIQFNGGGMSLKVFKKGGKVVDPAERELELAKKKSIIKEGDNLVKKDDTEELGLAKSDKVFTWQHVDYTVPVKGGKLKLLNDVSGYVKPGELTALMGASGAGKTTLLDVLADRKTIGVIEGDILIDGHKLGIEFQRGAGYCEQQDVHEFTATVREAFQFSAYLRQPAEVSKEEKDAYCEEIIRLLELEDLADAIIGFPGFGLGVEERKRVTIGVELAAKPSLLLFLDEPTSGLDSQSAFNVVRFLRKLADHGQAILCTIHQPNAILFEHFDRLLLLQKGGRTVYFGPIGKDSHNLIEYFAANGAHCPPDANPAEYMLEAIGAGAGKAEGNKDWADVFAASELHQINLANIDKMRKEGESREWKSDIASTEYSTSIGYQIKMVTNRQVLSFWRFADYDFTRLFFHVSIALVTGFSFFDLSNPSTVQDLQYRIFGIFIAAIISALVLTQVQPRYMMARSIFVREYHSKLYSSTAFAISMIVAEMPYSILCIILYFISYYFPAHYNFSPDRAGYAVLMLILYEVFCVTLGQWTAAIMGDPMAAANLNPFLGSTFFLFCGVQIPYSQIPTGWQWVRILAKNLDETNLLAQSFEPNYIRPRRNGSKRAPQPSSSVYPVRTCNLQPTKRTTMRTVFGAISVLRTRKFTQS